MGSISTLWKRVLKCKTDWTLALKQSRGTAACRLQRILDFGSSILSSKSSSFFNASSSETLKFCAENFLRIVDPAVLCSIFCQEVNSCESDLVSSIRASNAKEGDRERRLAYSGKLLPNYFIWKFAVFIQTFFHDPPLVSNKKKVTPPQMREKNAWPSPIFLQGNSPKLQYGP